MEESRKPWGVLGLSPAHALATGHLTKKGMDTGMFGCCLYLKHAASISVLACCLYLCACMLPLSLCLHAASISVLACCQALCKPCHAVALSAVPAVWTPAASTSPRQVLRKEARKAFETQTAASQVSALQSEVARALAAINLHTATEVGACCMQRVRRVRGAAGAV